MYCYSLIPNKTVLLKQIERLMRAAKAHTRTLEHNLLLQVEARMIERELWRLLDGTLANTRAHRVQQLPSK